MESKKRKIEAIDTEDTSINNERLFFDDFQVPLQDWRALYKVEAAGYIYLHTATNRLIMLIKTLDPNTGLTNGYEVHCQTNDDTRLNRALEITVPRDRDCEYTQDHMHHCLTQINEKYIIDGALVSQEDIVFRHDAFLDILGLVQYTRDRHVTAQQQKLLDMEVM